VALRLRLLLAEAQRFNRFFQNAQQYEAPLDRIGAALTQSQVVLAAPALVAVALQRQ